MSLSSGYMIKFDERLTVEVQEEYVVFVTSEGSNLVTFSRDEVESLHDALVNGYEPVAAYAVDNGMILIDSEKHLLISASFDQVTPAAAIAFVPFTGFERYALASALGDWLKSQDEDEDNDTEDA